MRTRASTPRSPGSPGGCFSEGPPGLPPCPEVRERGERGLRDIWELRVRAALRQLARSLGACQALGEAGGALWGRCASPTPPPQFTASSGAVGTAPRSSPWSGWCSRSWTATRPSPHPEPTPASAVEASVGDPWPRSSPPPTRPRRASSGRGLPRPARICMRICVSFARPGKLGRRSRGPPGWLHTGSFPRSSSSPGSFSLSYS